MGRMHPVLLFLLLSSFFYGKSQPVRRYEAQLALLAKIPEHVSWPNENHMERFRIALVTNDQQLIQSFQILAQKRKIKGKPLEISIINPFINSPIYAEMVFVSENQKGDYMDIFDQLEGKPCLLFTENYPDRRFVMVNFFDAPDHTLKFEINKANITNQKLIIDDELLLIGGSLIDVAELYRNSQQSFRSLEKKLVENKHRLDSFQNQLAFIEQLIQQKNDSIKSHQKLIQKDKEQLQKQLEQLFLQKSMLDSQGFVLANQTDAIHQQYENLTRITRELEVKEEKLTKENQKLHLLQRQYNSLNDEITENQKTLGQQSLTINRQRQILILFVIVIILSIGFISIVYYALKSNLKKRKLLLSKNSEIEQMVHELKTSNEDLNEKNEELFVTLEQLKNAQNQLLQSEKMASLGVLTAGIAHELNNPINFVYGGVNNLIRDLEDVIPVLNGMRTLSYESEKLQQQVAELQQMMSDKEFFDAVDAINQTVKDIRLGADRSKEIVKGLRNFSRTDSEEWGTVDVHECLNDTLILLQNRYKNRIEIVKQYDAELPLIKGLTSKLNQVFMNIISNAIEAISDKGTIKIGTQRTKTGVEIVITDTGRGMDELEKNKIFDPFFTTKKVGEGVGLGLAITYAAITEHGGTVEVSSQMNKGTSFKVSLPVNKS